MGGPEATNSRETPELTIDLFAGTEPQLREAIAIRQEVFVDEQGIDPDLEIDEFDGICWHALALLGPEPVGTARFIPLSQQVARIGRVAVRKEFRGKGVASRLMRLLAEYARREGYTRLVLDAQVQVIPFYETLGYEAEGEPFLDAGIVHRKMTMDLLSLC
jgi:predicted GNAT family N-acyltransferase